MQTKTRFAQWVKSNGLTYGEVAAISGISKSMLTRVARGERRLSAVKKIILARRLGVHVSKLFEVDAA